MSSGAGYHRNRMLLMMHLETRLVTAPLSVWGAMLMRPQPRTNVCVPIRKCWTLWRPRTSRPRGVVLPIIPPRAQKAKDRTGDQERLKAEARRQVTTPFSRGLSVSRPIGSNLLRTSPSDANDRMYHGTGSRSQWTRCSTMRCECGLANDLSPLWLRSGSALSVGCPNSLVFAMPCGGQPGAEVTASDKSTKLALTLTFSTHIQTVKARPLLSILRSLR